MFSKISIPIASDRGRLTAIKAQIDAGCRDREVRGKETDSLFEDVLPGNRPHSAVSAIIVLSAGNHHQGGQRSATDQTATGEDTRWR